MTNYRAILGFMLIIAVAAASAISVSYAQTQVGPGDWVLYRFTADVTKINTGEHGRISATFKVVFLEHEITGELTYNVTDVNVEVFESDNPSDDPVHEVISLAFSFSENVYSFYVDPAELNQTVFEEDDEYMSVRAEYDGNTGILRSARVDFKSPTGMEGYVTFEMIDTSVAGSTQGGFAGATEGSGAQARVRDGDWAVYQFSVDFKNSDGTYGRASAKVKVVFSVSDGYVDYSITDVNVEAYDTNAPATDPESDVRNLLEQFSEGFFYFYVEPETLNQSVYQADNQFFSYRVEYDKNTGVLRSGTLNIKPSTGAEGHVSLELIDTSIAGLLPAGGFGALGGPWLMIIVIIAIVAAIVVVVVVLLLKRKSRPQIYTPVQPTYGPTPPPPPPPSP